MEKIRVLQVCGGLSPEGIGVFLLNTMENIDTSRYEITFALATKYPQVYEERILKAGGKIIRTHEIGEGLKGKALHFINLIKILNGDKSFDVVHSHMDFFNGINLFAAFIARVNKRISHAHVAEKPHVSLGEKLYYGIMKTMITFCATHKVGCSKVANSNINGEGEVIYNGIDLNNFTQSQELPSDILFDRSKKNLMTVGRLDHQKNPFFMIEILKRLSLVESNFYFYWVGSGSLESEIKSLVKDLSMENYITFLKNRTDIAALLSHMDLFLLPSLYEGLPIVIIEAQASHLPCMVSTAVTEEVNVGLCSYLELERGAEYWALEIKNKLNTDETGKLTPDTDKLKNFDIHYMVNRLQEIYAL